MDISNIEKVYSGRANKCMCGCAGKWTYPADSTRAVKIIAGKVLKNSAAVNEGDYTYVVNGQRILVVYFK